MVFAKLCVGSPLFELEEYSLIPHQYMMINTLILILHE